MNTSNKHALRGWAVITTRPVGRGASLARQLRAAGATVHGLPCASLRATAERERAQRALAASRTAHAVIFTSPSAVRFAFALKENLRWPTATAVFAVGAATARALHRRGIAAQLPERYDSEGLLALPALARVRGARIDIITAPQGRDLLAERLRARGARVVKVCVYERVAPRWSSRHLAPLARLAARSILVVSSVDAIATLVARLPPPALTGLRQCLVVASSPRVAEAARGAGWSRIRLAGSALPSALCAACIGIP